MRRAAVALALLFVVLLAAPAAAGPRRHLAELVNGTRVNHGLERLHLGHRLSRYAEHHARVMARRGYLFHDDLSLAGRWAWKGENVGVGDTLASIERAFLASPEHRANVLGSYRRIGVGVVRRDGETWIVEVFVG